MVTWRRPSRGPAKVQYRWAKHGKGVAATRIEPLRVAKATFSSVTLRNGMAAPGKAMARSSTVKQRFSFAESGTAKARLGLALRCKGKVEQSTARVEPCLAEQRQCTVWPSKGYVWP